MPKIIEKIFKIAFEKCIQEEYKSEGDPLQMAYEKDRGAVSCNVITLCHIEKILKTLKEATAQGYIDLQNAFNKVYHPMVVQRAQETIGAGMLFHSWFEDRIYTFEGVERGMEFNCGVPAGTLWGVIGFKLFINTDIALTALNTELRWASAFSDDRSPLVDSKYIKNGGWQKDLDQSVAWAKSMGCEYQIGRAHV